MGCTWGFTVLEPGESRVSSPPGPDPGAGPAYPRRDARSPRETARYPQEPLERHTHWLAAPPPASLEAGFAQEQGGEVLGFRVHAGQAVLAEPPADVLRVPGQEPGPARVRDHVDHLRQVDHDQPPAVDQHVVGGQVAVGQAVLG